MFTGIVEETGKIIAVRTEHSSAYIQICASVVLDGTKIGDRIAINGAFQTVIAIGKDWFEVFASYETMKLTNLSALKTETTVNL